MSQAESQSFDLQPLLDAGLTSLLKDKEVATACRAWLREEAGCRPPINGALYWVLVKAADLTQTWAGSRLQNLCEKTPVLGRFAAFLGNINLESKQRGELKAKLVAAYNGELTEDQARLDAALPDDVIATLRAEQQFTNIRDTLDDLKTDIEYLVASTLRAMNQFSLDISWSSLDYGEETAAKAIRYDSGVFPFVGRDREFGLLDEFLGDLTAQGPGALFKWLTMVGPGGEGKTRLAYEYVKNRKPLGWAAGKLISKTVDDLLAGVQTWQPEMPTLFVIDYPAQYPAKIGQLLAALHSRARRAHGDALRLNHPVRVLLLERSGTGPWMEALLDASEQEVALQERIFRRTEFTHGWSIGALLPEAIIELMKARYRKAGLDAPEAAKLLTSAAKVDTRYLLTDGQETAWMMKRQDDVLLRPAPRALFAAAIAELAVRDLQEGQGDQLMSTTREGVLKKLITRDRRRHWKPALPNNSDQSLLDVHENALAVATLMRNLTRDQIDAFEACADYLPGLAPASRLPWNFALIRALGGSEDGTTLRGLEPDLLGEFHMLERLQGMPEPIRKQLIAAAYTLERETVQLTSFLTVRDFLDQAIRLDFLRPETTNRYVILAWMETTKDLVLQIAETKQWDDLRNLLNAIEHVQQRLSDDPAIALQEMEALTNAVSRLGDGGPDYFPAMHAALARASTLQTQFNTDPVIALEEVKALTNAVSRLGDGGPDHFPAMHATLARATILQTQFNTDPAIALQEMKTLQNAVTDLGEAGPDHFPAMHATLARATTLQTQFNTDPAIALKEMEALTNAVGRLGQAGPDHFPAMHAALTRATTLQTQFNTDPAIALEEMKALTNAVGRLGDGGPDHFPAMHAALARAATLQSQFNTDPAIALAEIETLMNAVSRLGDGGPDHFPPMHAALARATTLQTQFNTDPAIALAEMKALMNAVTDLVKAGPDHFPAMHAALARAATLQTQFNTDPAIALEEMKALMNAVTDLFKADVDQESARIERKVIERTAYIVPDQDDPIQMFGIQGRVALTIGLTHLSGQTEKTDSTLLLARDVLLRPETMAALLPDEQLVTLFLSVTAGLLRLLPEQANRGAFDELLEGNNLSFDDIPAVPTQ